MTETTAEMLEQWRAGRPRYAYFPFGGGPRLCIGDSFAMLEMQLVVAMVAQRYRPDLVPGHPVAPQPAISLRARYGMRMTLEALPEQGAVEAGASQDGHGDPDGAG